jgi:hypothetical protein
VVGVLLIASITVVRIPAEEHLLSERFGERYRVYRESTPPLVPVFYSSARKAAAAGTGPKNARLDVIEISRRSKK